MRHLLILALVLASFTMSAQSPPFEMVEPESLGFSSERLMRINKKMDQYISENRTAYIQTLIARNGEVFHFKSFGNADIESGKVHQSDHIFRIASLTKPVTAVALMILLEEGHFQLDDEVSNFIPEFRDFKVLVEENGERKLVDPKSPITIKQLLTHTSGLGYYFDVTGLCNSYWDCPAGLYANNYIDTLYIQSNLLDGNATKGYFIEKLSELPLRYQPGEDLYYSIGLDVVGYLVEVISGIPLDQYMKEMIFSPLGMKDTDFFVPSDKLNRFTTNYYQDPEGTPQAFDRPDNSTYRTKPSFFSGGAGLVSTMRDYLRFAQMLLNKGEFNGVRILSPQTVEFMTIDHLQSYDLFYPGHGLGLGFVTVEDITLINLPGNKGEYSATGAFNTYLWIDPEDKIIAMVWTQLWPYAGSPLAQDFKVLVNQALIE
ncbi:MAG: serine hydrolase domain-containing protein [Bacteroidota bacterium]